MTVKQIQYLLAYLGYDVVPDGVPGPQTKAAVTAFQGEYGGLAVDGDAGTNTCAALAKAVGEGWTRPEPQDKPQTGSQIIPAWWSDIKHFSRNEPYIACPCGKCGGFPVEPSEKLMRIADRVREHFDAPMSPSSTVRCKEHNAKVGGVANSLHMGGNAMDYSVQGFSAASVLPYVKSIPGVNYAYAIDRNHVHMDVK